MKYVVVLKPVAEKQLKRIDRQQARRILTKINDLSDDPFPRASQKLTGDPAYRLRVGDYRVLYEVRKQKVMVWVMRIQHRREVYKRR